jgi:hypothetical protein
MIPKGAYKLLSPMMSMVGKRTSAQPRTRSTNA